jgi:hypothetical protein
MIEIAFDFKGQRYGVRYNASKNIITYTCNYKPMKLSAFKVVLGESNRDTSKWRDQLRLTKRPILYYACK